MASQVSGYIGKINPGNGTQYALGSTAYGYCQTEADTAAKVVDMTGFKLVTGATIFVKFQYANLVASPTLNVNGTGAKPMYRYGTTAISTNAASNGWPAGAVLALTYDGAGWIEHFWYNNTYTIYGAYCTTAADTEAKVATCTYYTLQKGYVEVTMRYANTYEGALTLNIASKGAKPIYINGEASSASNYTLPGGVYLVYFDGTAYNFRTDGKLNGDLDGNALSADKLVPVLLAANQDLNDFAPLMTTWFWAPGAVNATLANSPLSGKKAFGMIAFRASTQYVKQIIIAASSSSVFMRHTDNAGESWTEWEELHFMSATVSDETLTLTEL